MAPRKSHQIWSMSSSCEVQRQRLLTSRQDRNTVLTGRIDPPVYLGAVRDGYQNERRIERNGSECALAVKPCTFASPQQSPFVS